jgi:hypothetical protein
VYWVEVTGHVIYDGQNPKNPTAGVLSVRDDVVVEGFRSLGAIILGVTIMTEAGMSPYGFNIHFQGPTNAFSSGHYSGGSSSGSAVSVATGNILVCRCRCVRVISYKYTVSQDWSPSPSRFMKAVPSECQLLKRDCTDLLAPLVAWPMGVRYRRYSSCYFHRMGLPISLISPLSLHYLSSYTLWTRTKS